MTRTSIWAGLIALLLLAGCGGGSATRPAQATVASQGGDDAGRQRAKVHTELGMAYLDGGQLTVALDEARIALNADPSYALTYNLLGLAHMQMKEYPRAEEHFAQALRLAPGDPEINGNMGSFLCQSGREARSFAYFEAAAKNPLYATPARPLGNAGQCASRIKDYKRAEDYLVSALRLDPGSIDAQYLLADVLYQQGRLGEARARLTDVHRRAAPTAASTWLALRIERSSGDRDAELRWTTQLRRKFADSAEYHKLTQGIFE
ncbi:MAG: type IV pilus biogenesis/stability protein PilW [Gammaproteobacteria bacterium]|nr:type IV pilus biogenesis/stability protein PilW [Gammaproteobacteria bacterium]MBU1646283.1 type IV pilus biogenesis/stability protein PilW [Gammaproteobacteria bacterium]MBU1970826.1 type IV pilus biogenesis/stability protein PilW [Gammaproteobacteria bacterium]